jgi:hypothetical protein
MMENQKIYRTIIFLLGIIILLMSTVFVANARNGANDIIDPQTKNLLDALSIELESISDLDQQKSLQEKMNILQYQAEVRVAAQENPPQKPTNICAAMPKSSIPEGDRPTGILPGSPGPFSSQILKVENQWQEQIDGYWMHVYAGISGLDDNLGGLMLWIEDVESGGFFADPQPDGALKIISVVGSRLELQSESGSLRYFDVLAQQFVSDMKTEVTKVELPAQIVFDPCGQN